MRVLYGKSKPVCIAYGVKKITIDVTVADICRSTEQVKCQRTEQTDYLEGYVVSEEWITPIKEARVVFEADKLKIIVWTDEDGYFRMPIGREMEKADCHIYAKGFKRAYIEQLSCRNGMVNIYLYKRKGFLH